MNATAKAGLVWGGIAAAAVVGGAVKGAIDGGATEPHRGDGLAPKDLQSMQKAYGGGAMAGIFGGIMASSFLPVGDNMFLNMGLGVASAWAGVTAYGLTKGLTN
jgi:hypothetical protein